MHRIDPRIVIIQIVLSGICAFWIFKPLAMLCEVLFLMSFLLYLQHPKEALRLGVWFAFLVGLYALLNESNAPQIIPDHSGGGDANHCKAASIQRILSVRCTRLLPKRREMVLCL